MGQINIFTNQEEEQEYSTQQIWSKLIKTRDGWRCANEDKYPDRDHRLFKLNAHHVLPKKHDGKNILSNGITYCRACHAAEHPEYQQNFFDVFKLQVIIIKDIIFGLIGLDSEFKYYRILHFITGKLSFRPLQKKIIKTIVKDKKHIFAVMPTGSGKSMLYQIPGLLNERNPSLVIAPLKALQDDQVSRLLERWIPATYINSSLNKIEIKSRIAGILNKLYFFVFIHPKQLLSFNENKQQVDIKYAKPLTSLKFDYMVVDEVHVVKNQGISFIKEYNYLDEIHKLYNKPQMILLTATASKKTRDFIVERLGIKREEIEEFVGGFKRPEISLEIYQVNIYNENEKCFISKNDTLLRLLVGKPNGKTIIFCTTTNQVDFIYDFLKDNGYEVCKYHSKLDDKEKELYFKLFAGRSQKKKTDIMIATSAFGMGIDISNIHQTIHYSLPFSLTDYYQQIGRAGRDGKKTHAQLLYDSNESTSVIDFINNKTIEIEKNEEIKKLLVRFYKEEKEALLGYVKAPDKWQYILNYFGEPDKTNEYKILFNIFIIFLFIFCVIYLLW